MKTARTIPSPDPGCRCWDDRWVQVEPLFFRSLDGSRRIGFKENASGRIFGLTAGSWRVLEKIR